jgi:hypothetical protein
MAGSIVSLVGPVCRSSRRGMMEYFTPIANSKPTGVVWKLFVATPALFTSTTVSHPTAVLDSSLLTEDMQPVLLTHKRICRRYHAVEVNQVQRQPDQIPGANLWAFGMHSLNGGKGFSFAAAGEVDFGSVSSQFDGRSVADPGAVLSVSF